MGLGPVPHPAKGFAEAAAEVGQPIFDLGRDDREHLSVDEPVALHRAQGLRQHLLADAGDQPRELGEAAGAMVLELFEHKQRPFVGDAPDQLVHQRLDARIDRRVRIVR